MRCDATRSRRWSRRARSAWASTSRTSASSCISAHRPPRSPTTSRWAGPGEPPSGPTCCCCPAPEDRDIWHYFASASMPRPEQAAPSCRPWTAPGDRCRPPPWRPRPTCAAPGSSCCSRSSTWTAPCTGSPAAGSRPASRGTTTRSATPGSPPPGRPRPAPCSTTSPRRGAGCGFSPRRWTTRRPPTAGAATAAPSPGIPRRCPQDARDRARQRLRRVGVEITPRSQWPTGLDRLGVPVRGRIEAAEQVEPGRAVARLTDLGWGQRLRTLLAEQAGDGPADDPLLAACIGVLRDWAWEQRPVAVVAVPSRRRPQLIASVAPAPGRRRPPAVARRPAAHAGRARPGDRAATAHSGWPGSGRRSASRRAMHALLDGLAGGPVLLVDDLVDSRWTMTVAGRALRRAGAGSVLPFALASVA